VSADGAGCDVLAVAHISNALGTVNPVEQIIEMAHHHGIPVLIDGAQAAPRVRIDVQARVHVRRT